MSLKMQAIAVVGAAVIRVLGRSWRIAQSGSELCAEARRVRPNVIYASWHGRLLPLSFSHRSRGIVVLASEHPDGEMLGQTIRRLGFGHARGSSTRGGVRAIRELVGWAERGRDIAVTVDGPKGPVCEVKPGVVEIARRTGAAIVPITTASNRHKVFRSWDRFQLPYPFARVRIAHGHPVTVPPDADPNMMETKRLELERELKEITDESDRMVRDDG